MSRLRTWPSPEPTPPTEHSAACPAPGIHRTARERAAVVAGVALFVAVVYTLTFRSTDGDPADRAVTLLLAPASWVIGAIAIGSLAALILPVRLHHTPVRWLATSLAVGIGTVLAVLTVEFGGYVLLMGTGS